jgi:hypothetical protein
MWIRFAACAHMPLLRSLDQTYFSAAFYKHGAPDGAFLLALPVLPFFAHRDWAAGQCSSGGSRRIDSANRMLSTQVRQNVHSKEQIMASVESGGSVVLQCSQVGRSSSMALDVVNRLRALRWQCCAEPAQ